MLTAHLFHVKWSPEIPEVFCEVEKPCVIESQVACNSDGVIFALDSFKESKGETYADVLCKLIEIAREDDEAKLELSDETLKGIEEAREDIRKGRLFSHKEVKKELGL